MKKCITVFTIYLVLVILITGTLVFAAKKANNDNESISNVTNVSDSNEGNKPSSNLDLDEVKQENVTDGDLEKSNTPIYTFDWSKASDTYGTYSQDDLEVVYETTNINGMDIDVPHIEGLINKEIEENIQNEIMDAVMKLFDRDKDPIYAYCNVYSHFGNTLSVMCDATYENGFEDYSSNVTTLNYNLVTGEKIYLDDLFTLDCNMANIFYTALYDSKVVDNYYEDSEAFYKEHPDYDEYFDEENYVGHADEEPVLREVNKFLSLPISEVKFVFTEEYTLIFDYRDTGLCYTLKYDKIEDLVNIYNKFEVEENIFEDAYKDVGQDGVFNFTVYRPYDKCEMFGFVEENVFVDFTSVDRGNEFYGVEKKLDDSYQKVFDEKLNAEYAYVNEMIEKAKSDKDHIYIIFDSLESDITTNSFYDSSSDEWGYDLTNLMCIGTYRNTYVIPADEYESIYKDKVPYRDLLIKAYKEHLAFAFEKRLEYKYDDDWNLLPEPYSTVERNNYVYLYDTGEEVTDVSKLFNVSDYMTEIYYAILNDESYDELGYLDLEAELLNSSNITYDAYGIRVELINHPEYYINLSYSEFNPEVIRVTNID